MISLKERTTAQRMARARPALAARRRRQLYPLFFNMGPVALSITSVLLIGLMAVLYLSQLGQAVAANQQIQDMRNKQADLLRQNQDLISTIAQERSPAYIAAKARQMGLVPADPNAVQVLIVSKLQPVQDDNPYNALLP
jgi:cell division protein FtsL